MDAQFLGYQYTRQWGPVALYNVTKEDHELLGSTVTVGTLQRRGLSYPPPPPPDPRKLQEVCHGNR